MMMPPYCSPAGGRQQSSAESDGANDGGLPPALKAGVKRPVGDPSEVVARRVEIYWEREARWYSGTVTEFRKKDARFRVEYDDGQDEYLDLSRTSYRLVEEPDAPNPPPKGRRRGGAAGGPASSSASSSSKPQHAQNGGGASSSAAAKQPPAPEQPPSESSTLSLQKLATVVWAKSGAHPWWPAELCLPAADKLVAALPPPADHDERRKEPSAAEHAKHNKKPAARGCSKKPGGFSAAAAAKGGAASSRGAKARLANTGTPAGKSHNFVVFFGDTQYDVLETSLVAPFEQFPKPKRTADAQLVRAYKQALDRLEAIRGSGASSSSSRGSRPPRSSTG